MLLPARLKVVLGPNSLVTNLSELTGNEVTDLSLLLHGFLGFLHQLFYILHTGNTHT